MVERTDADAYLAKAEESLASAEADFVGRRFNSCANRAYYACFQAAVVALQRKGFAPSPRDGQWRHDAVQARFVEQLINRRKRYPASVRHTLNQGVRLRAVADDETESVTELQAARGLGRAREIVRAVVERGVRDT